MHVDQRAARQDLDLQRGNLPRQLAVGLWPEVYDRFHVDSGVEQVEHRDVRVVVVHEQDGAPPRGDAVTEHVGRNRRGEHHAWAIVVSEDQWAFDRAGSQDDLLRPDSPDALPRRVTGGRPKVVGDTFEHGDEVVVVVSERGASREEADLVHGAQLRQPRFQPVPCPLGPDGPAAGQQASAELLLLVDQDDSRSGAARLQSGRDAGRARPDHEHVAVGVHLVVPVRVGLRRRDTQAAGLSELTLVEGPERPGPHEGLVVEAGRKEARDEAVDGAQVEADRRPAVDARRLQAVVQLDLGGDVVGQRLRARPELHQRVGLLDAAADDSARPVVLEAPADETNAVRQQRRGERVSLEAGVALAVERERERPAGIDVEALRKPVGLCHDSPRGGVSPMR